MLMILWGQEENIFGDGVFHVFSAWIPMISVRIGPIGPPDWQVKSTVTGPIP